MSATTVDPRTVRSALELAARAPSVHNTQPWRWRIGDSSVELELGIWIRDPTNGTTNVKSDVLLNVWDRFRQHGIEIPFPQRDLHIKSPGEFRVFAAPAHQSFQERRKVEFAASG